MNDILLRASWNNASLCCIWINKRFMLCPVTAKRKTKKEEDKWISLRTCTSCIYSSSNWSFLRSKFLICSWKMHQTLLILYSPFEIKFLRHLESFWHLKVCNYFCSICRMLSSLHLVLWMWLSSLVEILFKQKIDDQRNKEPNWFSVCDNLYAFMQLEFWILSDARQWLVDLEYAFYSTLMHSACFSLGFGSPLAYSHLGPENWVFSLTLQPVLLAQRGRWLLWKRNSVFTSIAVS